MGLARASGQGSCELIYGRAWSLGLEVGKMVGKMDGGQEGIGKLEDKSASNERIRNQGVYSIRSHPSTRQYVRASSGSAVKANPGENPFARTVQL